MCDPSELSLCLVITPLICTCLSVFEYVSCLGLQCVACHSHLPFTPKGHFGSLFSLPWALSRPKEGARCSEGPAPAQLSCSTSNNLVREQTLSGELTLKSENWADDQLSLMKPLKGQRSCQDHRVYDLGGESLPPRRPSSCSY
jgi:hypothetical protein